MSFEDRLTRTLLSVLGATAMGCVGATDGTTDSATTDALEAMCDGGPPPAEGYNVREGFVEVALGADCPPADQAELSYYGCSHTTWQGIVCAEPRKEENMVFVDDGYGGHHASATTVTTATTGVSEPLDLCWYEGVFFTDPDPTYTCGRPLLHEGRPVVAPVATRSSAWSDALGADASDLRPEERERLADFWLDAAVMEHASVASFARVSLDLMRFGAPPELLAATHRAAMDEVEHARLCFALAGAYRGEPVGPGPLEVPSAGATTLREVAVALLREGCIGETLAAVDAAARLANARDPAVRRALEVVVRDESEHAALAWRTLRWLLRVDPSAELRDALADVIASEATRWTQEVDADPASDAERAHGLLDPARRADALARAWHEVVAPSWDALAARG
ncbi:MAG: ferritin-like domain-containing protein [Alphaproteobacteria bacterium]|nr:ferritin-like domain-containing protein [Alphaproteobacteria bacterium]